MFLPLQKDEKVLVDQVSKAKELLEKDRNWGLIVKLLKEYQQKKVRDLTMTYLTLSFKELQSKLKTTMTIESIEGRLREMIAEGKVDAVIDAEKQMVSFIENTGNNDNQLFEIVKKLEEQNQRIMQLMQKVEQSDVDILKSQAYIKNFLSGGASAADAAEHASAYIT